MSIEIGIVGPHDLVDGVAEICAEQPGVATQRYDYEHESQAPRIVAAHAPAVSGWLFTGVVPYTLAREADALTRPAAFVDHTGATLLQALVQLLREGCDATRVSVDTLATADVTATFSAAGLPVEHVRTLPYRVGRTPADVVAFHRRQRRGTAGTAAAVTCLSSAHQVLREEMPTVRLAPSAHAVRIALRQLLLHARNQAKEDAQIALGLIALPTGDDSLSREAAALGATLATVAGGLHLLVTTRGPLAQVTGEFTALPMLQRLAGRHRAVHIGFGMGHSAAEAESLARRALARARRIGDVAGVVSLRGDTDFVLEATTPPPQPGTANLDVLAQRVGLSVPTLHRLREVHDAAGGAPLTTRDVAERLGVQQRTARRMLHRLELAGLAGRTGNLTSGTSGRPLTLYRLTL